MIIRVRKLRCLNVAKGLVVLAMVFMISIVANAQSLENVHQNKQQEISLKQALKIAKKQNFKIKLAKSDVNITRSQYRQTNAVFLPQVSLQEMAVTTNDPLNVFGFKLKQEIVSAADFNPVLLNNPDRTDNYTTKVEVKQPLININGFFQRSAMKNMVKASEEALKRTGHYMEFKVKETYYQLVLAKAKSAVIDSSLSAAKVSARQAKHFYDQGMINKADLLAAKVHVLDLESKKGQAQNEIKDANSNLKLLLGFDNDVELIPVDSLTMRKVNISDFDYARINQNRSDMKALLYQMKSSRKMLNANKFNFMPNLNVFGTYEWNDNTLFGTQANNYMIGASLKWDLFKGFKNVGAVEKSQAKLHKIKLTYQEKSLQNKMQIQSAYRSLQQSKKQVRLGNAAVKQAAENLRIRSNRYAKGLEKTTDLLMAEVSLSNAQLHRLMALFQYDVSAFSLELLTEKPLVN
ncbi:MAG TPA: TolC family protein [Balneolales bacterium]|nr:TolC family protein [Balneolales bacterium]